MILKYIFFKILKLIKYIVSTNTIFRYVYLARNNNNNNSNHNNNCYYYYYVLNCMRKYTYFFVEYA